MIYLFPAVMLKILYITEKRSMKSAHWK